MTTISFDRRGAACGLPQSGDNVAVVRANARCWQPWPLLIAVAGFDAALAMAPGLPQFCAQHALALSAAACAAVAAVVLMRLQGSSRRLVCDGRWLAYGSWLIGSLIDLHEVVAVQASGRAKRSGIREIALRSGSRELLRLKLHHWRDEDLRNLLGSLLQSNPRLQLDDSSRRWLRQDAAAAGERNPLAG